MKKTAKKKGKKSMSKKRSKKRVSSRSSKKVKIRKSKLTKKFKKAPRKKSKLHKKQVSSVKKEEFRGAIGMFCPKCGSLLIPKNEGGKRVLGCRCGFSTHDTKEAKLKEVVETTHKVEIIEKEHEPHPLTPAECPKCKHKMAYYWTVQTRASDEPETKFLKCEKCEHVWRDYS